MILESVVTQKKCAKLYAHAHLDDFSHAIRKFARRQRLQKGSVDEDILRLPKRPDEILAMRRVDGRLPAHARIHHGE